MASICFNFQVHQPFLLKPIDFFSIGQDNYYNYSADSGELLCDIAQRCYLPANKKLLQLIEQFAGRFKISFSISGTALEQMEMYCPTVLESFRTLVATGNVEIVAQTYYHSLSFLYSPKEFTRQVKKHHEAVRKLFGVTPRVFKNTEQYYSNDIARAVEKMGYHGILLDGADSLLMGRSPDFVYQPINASKIRSLINNQSLSDHIAWQFSNPSWQEYPITGAKYASWLQPLKKTSQTINLFMNYETFGERHLAESGIFKFLEDFTSEILQQPEFDFKTPSEVLAHYPIKGTYDVAYSTSWADAERELSVWMENYLQREAIERLYGLENEVLASNNEDVLGAWSKLQTSDHFYHMSTKQWKEGNMHLYTGPYSSPYEAYINYMNILTDLEESIGIQPNTV